MNEQRLGRGMATLERLIVVASVRTSQWERWKDGEGKRMENEKIKNKPDGGQKLYAGVATLEHLVVSHKCLQVGSMRKGGKNGGGKK